MSERKRVLSGIQPSGVPHLGNYLGALRWWVDFQDRYDAFYCVVDLHALTVPGDPAELRYNTLDMATALLACGLRPDACTLFVQSHVPQHTELAWLLECTASMGEMYRMTQFKDKVARGSEEAARVGLFAYPVLMAADIVLYDADLVPVGDDPRQHLELTRDLAERWNGRYGTTLVVPDAAIPANGQGARIMDLQDPGRKMSKSTGTDAGLIYLFDDPKTVERKIKRAVTDLDPPGPGAVRWDRKAKPGVSNLLELIAALEGGKPEDIAGNFDNYGSLKSAAALAVNNALAPVRERYVELARRPDDVRDILREGAKKAGEVAAATVARARQAVGLLAP
jgi:tryptophanyl-tRNA synthetase